MSFASSGIDMVNDGIANATKFVDTLNPTYNKLALEAIIPQTAETVSKIATPQWCNAVRKGCVDAGGN
jgi:hypothetical protein